MMIMINQDTTKLIRNIHLFNVIFNLYTENPEITGESSINIIVKQSTTSAEIVLVQHMTKLSGGYVNWVIGAVILGSVITEEPVCNGSYRNE